MRFATTIIIGAGHSGLAMSRHLTARSIDHVVLERGEVAHSWRPICISGQKLTLRERNATPAALQNPGRHRGIDGVIGRLSLWIAEDFRCCASG